MSVDWMCPALPESPTAVKQCGCWDLRDVVDVGREHLTANGIGEVEHCRGSLARCRDLALTVRNFERDRRGVREFVEGVVDDATQVGMESIRQTGRLLPNNSTVPT